LNGLFNTNGQDITSSAVGFTIYDTYGNTYNIERYPSEAAKMVYTNVFYDGYYYAGTDLISGVFLPRTVFTKNESYPEAFIYNNDLDYLDVRETTYVVTNVENTNWYNNDYNGVIILMKQKLKDKDYINSINTLR
jgi:hypothetical protein